MAWFNKKETGRPAEDVILDLVLEELARRGQTAAVSRHEEGYRLTLSGGGHILFLANLTRNAQGIDPRHWPELVAGQIGGHLDDAGWDAPEELSADELRSRIRTRLLSDQKDEWSSFDYARPFAPGIIQVLCVDCPHVVTTLGDDSIPQMALTLEEMYFHGQENTDAEPIDERFEVAEFVHGLTGESLFIASKAGNFPALVRGVIGRAPLGVVFAVPNRSLLLFSVVTQEHWLTQVMRLARTVDGVGFNPEFNHPGGLISPYAYYWAPDGTVERISGRCVGEDGEDAVSLDLTGNLSEYVDIEEGGGAE
jgi:hypothetical protein